MNAKPTLANRSVPATILCAALAALAGFGLLSTVAGAFRQAGVPFEQVVVAERACASGHAYASERATCVRAYLAAARVQHVASR